MRGSLGCLQRRAGKQEVAGALRARATPRLCLLAEEEEDKGGRWAGPTVLGWLGYTEAGPEVRLGKFLSLFYFFCFFFATVFKFKQIQNSAKYPLNNLCC